MEGVFPCCPECIGVDGRAGMWNWKQASGSRREGCRYWKQAFLPSGFGGNTVHVLGTEFPPLGRPRREGCRYWNRRIAMEEYLRVLLDQIHCRKAREMVGKEMKNHILDQMEANQQAGMEREQALEEAVRDMGDPVEAGMALNKIHRFRTDWRMLALVGLVSVINILVHIGIGGRDASLGEAYGLRHSLEAMAGFGIMLAVYRMDYNYIGKYAKQTAVFFFLAAALVSFAGTEINGARAWISLGVLGTVAVADLAYLYIPVYGALLYRYRGEGYRGVGKCILWMSFPLCVLLMNRFSTAVCLFFILAAMLSVAVGKDWFRVNRKAALAALWTVFGALPLSGVVVLAISGNYYATYKTERIRAFLGQESSYQDYGRRMAAEYWKSSRLLGGSGREITDLVGVNNDYLLNYVANYYGIAIMLLIGLLLFAVAARVIHVSFSQKNPLGMIMGCGCGLFLEMVTVIAVLHCLGLIPSARLFLPFFSADVGGLLVAYVMAGIVLSVYRYQSVVVPGQV